MNKKDLQAFKVVTCCHNRQKTWLYKVLIQHMGVSIAYVIVPSTPVTQTADSVGLVRQSSFRRAGYFRLLVWTYLSLSPTDAKSFPLGGILLNFLDSKPDPSGQCQFFWDLCLG